MTFKLHALQKAFLRLFVRSRNESLAAAASMEREALLKWLDTSEEGLFDREAEDRLALFSRAGKSCGKAKVLRRDKRSIVQGEIAAIFSVNFVANGPQWREIAASELVPGDLVELSEGDIVPMDVRLLSCDDFHVDQSSLTGLTMPVRKYAGVCVGVGALDFPNIALGGMIVVKGSAIAVVISGAPLPSKKPIISREAGNLPTYGFLVPQR